MLSKIASKCIRENLSSQLGKASSLRVKIKLQALFKELVFAHSSTVLAVRNAWRGTFATEGDAGVEVLLEGERRKHQMFYG